MTESEKSRAAGPDDKMVYFTAFDQSAGYGNRLRKLGDKKRLKCTTSKVRHVKVSKDDVVRVEDR